MTDRIERLSEALAGRGLRLVTAESCTGGLLSARLTDRPGASAFLHAGLITYADQAKRELLGVDAATLIEHGAVSEPVVREMLRGALRSGDAAVAITGVAGPGGGTAAKPVGTVWIGVAVGGSEEVRRFLFPGDRTAVREASVEAALEMLEHLLEALA
ncbi:MAG: CinA family protein [Gemmatimonadota bacterium]